MMLKKSFSKSNVWGSSAVNSKRLSQTLFIVSGILLSNVHSSVCFSMGPHDDYIQADRTVINSHQPGNRTHSSTSREDLADEMRKFNHTSGDWKNWEPKNAPGTTMELSCKPCEDAFNSIRQTCHYRGHSVFYARLLEPLKVLGIDIFGVRLGFPKDGFPTGPQLWRKQMGILTALLYKKPPEQ